MKWFRLISIFCSLALLTTFSIADDGALGKKKGGKENDSGKSSGGDSGKKSGGDSGKSNGDSGKSSGGDSGKSSGGSSGGDRSGGGNSDRGWGSGGSKSNDSGGGIDKKRGGDDNNSRDRDRNNSGGGSQSDGGKKRGGDDNNTRDRDRSNGGGGSQSDGGKKRGGDDDLNKGRDRGNNNGGGGSIGNSGGSSGGNGQSNGGSRGDDLDRRGRGNGGGSSSGGWSGGNSQGNGQSQGGNSGSINIDRRGSGDQNNSRIGSNARYRTNNNAKTYTSRIGKAPIDVFSGSLANQVRREDRVREHRRDDYRVGYHHYNRGWCDDNFYGSIYIFAPDYDVCVVSPFYSYSFLPAYMNRSRVIIINRSDYLYPRDGYTYFWSHGTMYRWYRPQWYDNNSRTSSLDRAVDDIVYAFEENSRRAIGRLVPTRGNIGIYLDERYDYSLNADDFYDMMIDNISNARTKRYDILEVRTYRNEARVLARHDFYDADDRLCTTYHTYRLVKRNGEYEIAEFGTSDYRPRT